MTLQSQRVRLTISVTEEVHQVFSKLASAGNISLSRAMGEWLEDTLEAAEYTANMVVRARAAPREVMREVHAYALGVADETGTVLTRLREKGAKARMEARSADRQGLGALSPPSSNTGGKVPKAKPSKGKRDV